MSRAARWSSFCSACVFALLIALACGGPGVGAQGPGEKPPSRIASLHAFARLYGIVRWFHPSDAAAAVDWNQFAIDGVRRVMPLTDARELRATLSELFAPIAPTVQIAAATEPFRVEPALQLETAGLEQVAWEHRGFGDSTVVSVYASKRRHRVRVAPVRGMPFASLSQSVDAAPFRGARVRLRGQARVANRGLGQLWLRVDRGETRGFFNNMDRSPVTSVSWVGAEIVGTVDADATRIVVGVLMDSPGTVWYDDLELAVQPSDGTWTPIAIDDPGFESADLSATWKPGTAGRRESNEGWNLVRDSSNPASGSSSLRIERIITSDSTELFSDAPEPGETVDVDLGSGLRARIPLILPSRDGQTLGDRAPSIAPMSAATAAQADFDVAAGIADVVVVWNVLQHFWPYWDVVATDWNAALDVALADAADDRTVTDHVATLERLTAGAPDAHVSTTCRGRPEIIDPPFAVEVVEDKVVVIATATDQLTRGDVITAIDGERAAAHLQSQEALVSGSPQWRRLRASQRFGMGARGSSVTLGIVRNGAPLAVTVKRAGPDRRASLHIPRSTALTMACIMSICRARRAATSTRSLNSWPQHPASCSICVAIRSPTPS
jgi:hypothetical protein